MLGFERVPVIRSSSRSYVQLAQHVQDLSLKHADLGVDLFQLTWRGIGVEVAGEAEIRVIEAEILEMLRELNI